MRRKKILKIILLFLIVVSAFFAGHENPEIIIKIKNISKNITSQIGKNQKPPENQLNKNDSVNQQKKVEKIIDANSFKFQYVNVVSFEEKTAGVIFGDSSKDYKIFTQNGFLIDKTIMRKLEMPKDFYTDQDGGIKSVFIVDNNIYFLLSKKENDCFFASLMNFTKKIEVMRSKCIPDSENINFAGLGGAYIFKDEELLLSIGTPTHISDIIDKLSQDKDSIFGKIISIKTEEFKTRNEKINYNFFSIGHRNPQGLTKYKEKIFSLEHGPQGGDELNEIIEDSNYGWPIASYGTRYNNGKGFARSHADLGFKEPIYSFLPAVAPSSLTKCPNELQNYYNNSHCLIGLSLREMSLLIILLNNKNSSTISIEKIKLDKRLRNFGVNKKGELFIDENGYFYFSSDTYGLFKGKFFSFR